MCGASLQGAHSSIPTAAFCSRWGWVPSGHALVHPDGGCFVPGRGWVRCQVRTRPSERSLVHCVCRWAGFPSAFWCATLFLLPFGFSFHPFRAVCALVVRLFFFLLPRPPCLRFLLFPDLGARGLGALRLPPTPPPLGPLSLRPSCVRPFVASGSGCLGPRRFFGCPPGLVFSLFFVFPRPPCLPFYVACGLGCLGALWLLTPAPYFFFCCCVSCYRAFLCVVVFSLMLCGVVVRCVVLSGLPRRATLSWSCCLCLLCPPPFCYLCCRACLCCFVLFHALFWGAVPCCSAAPPVLRCAGVSVVYCCLVPCCLFSTGWCHVLLPVVSGSLRLGPAARCCLVVVCSAVAVPAALRCLLPRCLRWFVVVPCLLVLCPVVLCFCMVLCCGALRSVLLCCWCLFEDPDLSALSAALTTKLGLYDLKKPPPTMSPGVQPLTRDAKSGRGIRSSPMDTCPSPFPPRLMTVPSLYCRQHHRGGDEELWLGCASAISLHALSPPSGGTGEPGVPDGGTKAIATANLQMELPKYDPKNLQEWAEEFSEFLLLTGQHHADVGTKCKLITKFCKKKFLQRPVKTVIRRSSNWGDFLKRL